MHVKDYMQEIIIAVSPNDLLSTARRIMNELFIRLWVPIYRII